MTKETADKKKLTQNTAQTKLSWFVFLFKVSLLSMVCVKRDTS